MAIWIILGVVLFLILAVLIISYVCFRMAFYQKDRGPRDDRIRLPKGEIYEEFREKITEFVKEVRAMPHEDVSIISYDGLKLVGKYYEYEPGATIELMFHGYRGSAECDLAGGVQRCFALKRSALIVSQRCSDESDGNVITFGIREHKDCLSWVDFMLKRFGPDVKIILTGISMGASTVLLAADKDLPTNVIGILADCGYSSAKDIIKKVIKQMGLPVALSYPFVRLGGLLYGRFDIEETAPTETLKNCKVPVIFYHGENDDFVPCEMSKINFDACTAKKKLITIEGAGHGLSYLVAPEKYLSTLDDFFN